MVNIFVRCTCVSEQDSIQLNVHLWCCCTRSPFSSCCQHQVWGSISFIIAIITSMDNTFQGLYHFPAASLTLHSFGFLDRSRYQCSHTGDIYNSLCRVTSFVKGSTTSKLGALGQRRQGRLYLFAMPRFENLQVVLSAVNSNEDLFPNFCQT